ncbi:MAG: hypothetical protein SFV55_23750 [Haliscomenobacter sp.]|uniref:hypothetical protein n=1 Tax=Haliscomenobacter sp. TaxID=2717303 RepID=UPI0029B0CA5C|nr:hypothetical protein [Haliscomenobacter sp.]MDX2071464.1 hypothetical protein [Haliscomenobacter sp.]
MKKLLLFLIAINLLCGFTAFAQSTDVAQGINFQAVARDEVGQIISNQPVSLKIALVSKNGSAAEYYSETHQVITDQNGLFQIIIGEGKEANGKLADVPWAKDQIWLNVSMDAKANKNFALVSSAKLLSVPYAMHAATAGQIVNEDAAIDLPFEKNQSIYWTTGGNSNTSPAIHFLGTRDNKDLVIKTNNTTRMNIMADGRIRTFSVCPNNGDGDPESYAIVAKGCKQGVFIKVNGSRSNATNFVTFADDDGIHGAIEGETASELADSWAFKSQNAIFVLKGIALLAEAIADGIEAGGQAASGLAAGAAAGSSASAIAKTTEQLALAAEAINWNAQKFAEVGVSYSSGSADYAEWLARKKGERDMHPGEIVGVKAGQISLATTEVDHFMVISTRPIILGNAPQPENRQHFEKVAFMGQVPVRIAGAASIGDYILPSGNNDGVGIAVHPTDMKLGDYSRIVGVAWEAAKEAPMNLVKVAVGINSNDLTRKVDELNQKVDQIMAYLDGKTTLNPDGTLMATTPTAKPQTTLTKQLSDEEFDQLIDQHSDYLTQLYANTKKTLIKQGYDPSNSPMLVELLDNPIPTIKKVRRDPNYLTQWAFIDQKFKSTK